MFGKNVGETVKNIARVMVWLGMAAGLLIGISTNISVFLMVEKMSAFDGLLRALSAILLIALCGGAGFVAGWISAVLLYAFGELVSRAQTISEDLDFLCRVKEDDIAREEAEDRSKTPRPAPPVPARTWAPPVMPEEDPLAYRRPAKTEEMAGSRVRVSLEKPEEIDPEAPPF